MQYQLNAGGQTVTRIDDGGCIAMVPANRQYLEYLEWVAQGNTPLAAPGPDIKAAALADIDTLERGTMMPRSVREFMLGSFADRVATGIITAEQLAVFPAYVKLKALDDQVKTLRGKLK